MKFWKIILLLIINIIVSVGATLATLHFWDKYHGGERSIQLIRTEPTAAIIAAVPETAEPVDELLPTDGPDTEVTEETEAEGSVPVDPTPVIRGANVTIPIIRTPGNLETEAVRIMNNSDTVVNLEAWTLEDANGNVFRFPSIQLLRNGIFIELYTRSGHNTAYELYWNQNTAVWQSGETAVIKDQLGQVQATYRVP